VPTQNVPLSIYRNGTRINGAYVHYSAPMSTVSVAHEEELPPSYESFISSSRAQGRGTSNWY